MNKEQIKQKVDNWLHANLKENGRVEIAMTVKTKTGSNNFDMKITCERGFE